MITVITQFAADEAESATGIAALGIDARAFIIQLVTFLFVYLILRKFVFKRIVDALHKRQQTIDQGVKLTTQLTSEKEALDREIADAHKKARKEADKIISDSHAEAKAMLKDAEVAAQAKATAIIEDAHKKIEDDVLRARRDLEKEMVELVVQATEAVSREKLDAKKDNALITSALKGQA